MQTQTIQLRDNSGYLINYENGLDSSQFNQDATLTVSTVKTFTVPLFDGKTATAVIKYTDGADVFCIPAATPTLTAPSGTVRDTTAVLRPKVLKVTPGQTLQFLYANTVYAGSTVTVSIAYYINLLNN